MPGANNQLSSDNTGDKRLAADIELVKRINEGCVESWHHFVRQYSDLIYSVIHQQLLAEDSESIQTVFVDVLENLYRKSLRSYQGKATLSTWVMLVTRAKAVDYLRHKGGRHRPPQGYDKLGEFEKEVFQLLYVEGISFSVLAHAMVWNHGVCDADSVSHAVLNIEKKISRRYLRQLEYDRAARGGGIASRDELQYHIHARMVYETKAFENQPDQRLYEEEAEVIRSRIMELCSTLPEKERELLDLRFRQGWTARRISKRLGIQQRRVYWLIDSVLAKVKRLFNLESVANDTQASRDDAL